MDRSEDKLKELRITILEMIHAAKSGHPGGSLSCLEILVSLFSGLVRFDPKRPDWPDRDRVILSKGHGVPALYAVLAEVGCLPKEALMTLRQLSSPLQGHPDRVRLPVVEAATGSLGQGLSIAQGVALALKLDSKDSRVFCICGDGEIQEGQIWETAMSAPKFGLTNLTVILDYNHGQIDGRSDEIMSLEPLLDKWRSFNWECSEVDGHDCDALQRELSAPGKSAPRFVLAHTVKGHGVSFMESVIDWHGKAPSDEELQKAIQEIRA
ncbi:MAG: transketolase [Bradymonadales bacterium]|nr:MAG: transketolase [Bradymonadales bacterium]